MTHFNKDSDFEAFHYRASADYVYARFEAERVQRLPRDFSLFGKVTGQVSNENLLGSEQLGGGGYSTVRGYEERAVNADEGYIVNFELRTPTFSPSKELHLPNQLGDQLQFLLFYDYAYLFDHTLKPKEPSNFILASFGPGIRYTIPPYLTVRFDYGFQLRDPRLGPELDRHRASRMHLGILLSY
jgi:hemolysin activation/secretion protein